MEKKSTGKTVVIVILVLLVLGLGGYIVYDKFVASKEETKEEQKAQQKTETANEDLEAVATTLVNKLDKYYVDSYDNLGKADFTQMSNQDKMLSAFLYGNVPNLSKSTVDDYFKNLFGITLKEYPNLNCWANDGVYAKYNTTTGEYELQTIKTSDGDEVDHAHGGPCILKSNIIKYNNIEKIGDNYVVTVTKVFGPAQGLCEGTPENAFYADYKYTVKIPELTQFAKTNSEGVWDSSTADLNGAKQYYEQNYNQFKDLKPQYKYTFKKGNKDYYLISFETIK